MQKLLTKEVTHLFAHENHVANRCVATAIDKNYFYTLWVDGHVDRQPHSDERSPFGYARIPRSEPAVRPAGLEWRITEFEPAQRIYVYALLFGEKIKPEPS